MTDFLTLNLPLALELIRTKIPSFWPIGQKMPFFNGKFSQAIENSKFSCIISIFWPMVLKDLVLINAKANANGIIFRVKNSDIALKSVFLEHLVLKNMIIYV